MRNLITTIALPALLGSPGSDCADYRKLAIIG
jgi:hypothetical protein